MKDRPDRRTEEFRKHIIEVMSADGPWEFRRWDSSGDCWDPTIGMPKWDWYDCDYRPIQKPKYRPWQTTAEVPVGRVIRGTFEGNVHRAVITHANVIDGELGIGYGVAGHGRKGAAGWFLKHWTMDDGSPCGVLE